MQKLKVCYNILNDFSCIPSSSFTLHPRPSPRHPHNRIIFMPLVKTVAHKSSFFIDVIYLWNILPLTVVSSQSPSSFKSALQNYMCTLTPFPCNVLLSHPSNFCYLLICLLLLYLSFLYWGRSPLLAIELSHQPLCFINKKQTNKQTNKQTHTKKSPIANQPLQLANLVRSHLSTLPHLTLHCQSHP